MIEKFIVTTLVTWDDGEAEVLSPVIYSDKEFAEDYAKSQIETAKKLNHVLQMDVYVDQDTSLHRLKHLSWRKGRE